MNFIEATERATNNKNAEFESDNSRIWFDKVNLHLKLKIA
jgi:hypothetical protein